MTAHKMTKQGTGERAWFECSCGFVWLGTYFPAKGRKAEAEREHAIAILVAERTSVYDELDAGTITVEEWRTRTHEYDARIQVLYRQ